MDYKDGSLHSVKWYKLEEGKVRLLLKLFNNIFFHVQMVNFYSYVPSKDKQRPMKQTKHKGTGLKVIVSSTQITLS